MKSSSILILLLIATSSLADSCDNPLIDALEITALDSPIIVSNLPYCTNLQDGSARSCCTADTINEIQAKQDAFKEKMQSKAGKRDKLMKESKDSMETLNDAATQFTDVVSNIEDQTVKEKLINKVKPIKEFIQEVKGDIEAMIASFKAYQEKRATCFSKMLEIQGGAFCLACDAKWADRGVDTSTGDITMSDSTCHAVIDACFPFLQASLEQNKFIKIGKAADLVQGYANISADISGQKRPSFHGRPPKTSTRRLVEEKPPKDYSDAEKDDDGIPIPTRTNEADDESQRVIDVPEGCDDENNKYDCTWLCNTAFNRGRLNAALLGAGGKPQDAEEETSTDLGRRRVLAATGTWTTSSAEVGTNTDVLSDPDGITLGGGLSLITKAIAMLGVVFLYIVI